MWKLALMTLVMPWLGFVIVWQTFGRLWITQSVPNNHKPYLTWHVVEPTHESWPKPLTWREINIHPTFIPQFWAALYLKSEQTLLPQDNFCSLITHPNWIFDLRPSTEIEMIFQRNSSEDRRKQEGGLESCLIPRPSVRSTFRWQRSKLNVVFLLPPEGNNYRREKISPRFTCALSCKFFTCGEVGRSVCPQLSSSTFLLSFCKYSSCISIG